MRDIVRYVENTSDDNKEDAIVNLGLAYDTGVLDKGKNEYSKFLNYYRLNKHFSEGESSWTFDADRHEFYIGYKVEASGIYSSNPQVCTMVFTFNDAWKLIDIQIVEGYVDSIHNYRQ